MLNKLYLYTPGPTPVPPQVQAAMSQPMVGHRSKQFAELHRVVVEKAKKVFQTDNDLFILTNSGTGGLETAIANTVSPGEKVLAVVTGRFGERFADIAESYGADVTRLDYEWGTTFDLEQVRKALKEQGPFKAVLATHNETSTGVTNDIASLGRLVADTGAILLVDAVSSMGAMDIRTDEWQVDVMVTGSQKAFMLPPGLALVSVSDKAWKVIERSEGPAFYFNLLQARKAWQKHNTAWTPAVSLIYGLDAVLDMLLEEGLPEVFVRHERMARAVRAAVRALGLPLFAPDAIASHTVTAVAPGPEVPVNDVLATLRDDFGVTFAGGQGKLKGHLFRIGHMGYCSELDVLTAIAALEMALHKVGAKVQMGAGVQAAQEALLNITRVADKAS